MATSAAANGPWVRACRLTRSPTRVGDRDEERLGQPDRQGGPERVAQPGGVLDRGEARLPADTDLDRAPLADQPLRRGGRVLGHDAAPGDLGDRERAQDAEQVGDVLGVAGAPLGDETLQLLLRGPDGLGVEQVAQRRAVAATQQLGEQLRVQRQRGGPALGQWRVALVEELRDVAEQQRARHGRRRRGLDLDDPHLAGGDLAHERP